MYGKCGNISFFLDLIIVLIFLLEVLFKFLSIRLWVVVWLGLWVVVILEDFLLKVLFRLFCIRFCDCCVELNKYIVRNVMIICKFSYIIIYNLIFRDLNRIFNKEIRIIIKFGGKLVFLYLLYIRNLLKICDIFRMLNRIKFLVLVKFLLDNFYLRNWICF